MTAVAETLVGRETERADLDASLDPDLLPTVVVIEGKAGIGKTSLGAVTLEAARARGFTTLVAHPLAAETDLAFAGLGDLLEPVLADVLDSFVRREWFDLAQRP